jgi:hypothetical protein
MLPAKTLIFVVRLKLGGRAPIDAADHLVEPTMRHVLAPEGAGIAMALKPSCINKQSLWEVELQPV